MTKKGRTSYRVVAYGGEFRQPLIMTWGLDETEVSLVEKTFRAIPDVSDVETTPYEDSKSWWGGYSRGTRKAQ